jgi:hypothetical protein
MSSPSPAPVVAPATTPDDAEPDVTWGKGGIDDWGWNHPQSEPSQDKGGRAS